MTARRARTNKTPEIKTAPTAPRHFGLIAALLVTVLLGGIPFGLGKYIEFNSPGPFDSGAYVYSAKHLLEGARWGVDEVSSAYPGTLLVNVIGVKLFGFSDTGPKIVQMILQLGALGFMFYALRRVFGGVAAVFGTVMAAVYLSAPLIAKYGNVKEQYMLAFVISAACGYLLYEFSGKRFWLVLSGIFCIQPYFFKPTGLSILFAIVGYLLATRMFGRHWKKLFVELALFLAGATVGMLFPASLYIWQQQTAKLLHTLPARGLQMGWLVLLVAAALYYAVLYSRKYQLVRQLRSVSPRIYRRGAIALAAALLVGIAAVAAGNIVVTRTSDYPTNTAAQDIVTYIQSIPMVSIPRQAFNLVLNGLLDLYAAAGLEGGYVGESRKLVPFAELAPKVLRYYKALSVPILAAVVSIAVAAWTVVSKRKKKQPLLPQSRFVWMLAAWWVLDMAFVWVSPHSYEQYYLPLCASAAVLSGYAVWKWQQKFSAAAFKMPWLVAGAAAAVVFAGLSVPIFAGQRYSPDTGTDYTANGGPKKRGFAESLTRIKEAQSAPWQSVGDYIRTHSTEEDRIYVWGWVPGIYVQAQRLAPVPTAYEANMHITPPGVFQGRMLLLTWRLQDNPPKFIVDTRKRHFPFNRPPLELWPHTAAKNNPYGTPIPNDPTVISQYDQLYKKLLAEQFDPRQQEYSSLPGLTTWLYLQPWTKAMPDEAKRYDAMEPLRTFVMNHYRIVGQFGEHVLFERKQPSDASAQ